MYRFVPRIVAVLLLVVTLAPAAAGDRPFKASGEGSVGSSDLTSSCEATHLGRSRLNVGYFSDFLQFGLLLSSGGTLDVASGDGLYFVFDEEGYYLDQATGIVSTTVTFTGGTGRFQDVTGSADLIFDFDSNFQRFEFLIDGSIDY
jgi:hypothetical protein